MTAIFFNFFLSKTKILKFYKKINIATLMVIKVQNFADKIISTNFLHNYNVNFIDISNNSNSI